MARSIKKELAALLLAAAVLAPGQASASKLEVTSKADIYETKKGYDAFLGDED